MSNLSGSGTLRGVLGRGGGTPSDVYWDDILDKPEFATVATSGSYNDLLDKPAIPPAPSVMIGATEQSNGVAGYVTQPHAGDQDKFFNGAGEWVTPPSNSINYSTTEQEIGTWIDGSPLYQRTWFFSSPVNVNQNAWGDTPILVSDTNINYIVECQSMSSNGFNQPIGATTDGGTTTYVRIFNVRSNSGIAISYLTLKYTKTTDTLGGE